MLSRWQSVLEQLNVLLLLLSAIYCFYQFPADLNDTLLLYGVLLFCTIASLCLKPACRTLAPLRGFAWLEQYMALTLLLTLLCWLYLPLAPYAHPATALLWLACQFALPGLALRISQLWRQRPDNASATPSQHWLIGYASQSGMAQQLANHSALQLRQAGIQVTLTELNQLTQQQLLQYQKALFVVSTYGDGEPPDNASQFYQLAQKWQHNLQQLEYAVLALGDRSYQQFCAFGHWLHGWLAHNQATALQPLLELDSAQRQSQALNHWQQLLTQISAHDSAASAVAATSQPWQPARLLSRYVANPGSSGLACYVIKLQLAAASQWQAGDLVDIQPQNSKCDVALWLTRQQINGCQCVSYRNRQVPLCWALAELQLDQVSAPASNEALADWLRQQPLLPVRTYSIASITEEGHLMLLVRQVQRADGSLGVGSGWLTAWAIEQQPLQLRLRSHHSFQLPDDDRPVIFIANGTGIAGIRALLAERVKRRHAKNWLLFGERRQQTDFFFAREIQQWQQQGFIQHCDLAFSQDQAEKRYVQHILAQHTARLHNWLAQGAAIYVCGSRLGMGQAVQQCLLQTLGADSLTLLQQQGRYRRDLY